jgi:hypothetical protein
MSSAGKAKHEPVLEILDFPFFLGAVLTPGQPHGGGTGRLEGWTLFIMPLALEL